LEQRNMESERGDAALYQTDLELEQSNVTSEVKTSRSRRLILAPPIHRLDSHLPVRIRREGKSERQL